MRELEYTVLELEKESKKTCDFCSKLENRNNESVHQIRSRTKVNREWIADDMVCERCEEKYWNDELLKCNRCGRLQTKLDFDIIIGKNVCYCIRSNEDLEEKELPLLPNEEISQSAFYERQINSLQEEKTHLATEAQSHLDAMEAFEVYNKKHRREWLDRIKDLEAEVERLKKQTPQELLDEISELKGKVKQLEEQNNQLIAQVEVKEVKKWPWKLKK